MHNKFTEFLLRLGERLEGLNSSHEKCGSLSYKFKCVYFRKAAHENEYIVLTVFRFSQSQLRKGS